jgi:putative photosynthetic complex assembly protein 2
MDGLLTAQSARTAPARPVTPPLEGVRTTIAMLVGFWWLATGLILAMQRTPVIENASLFVACVLGVYGAWLVRDARMATDAAGARRSMLGGALIWGWVAATFYGGWIVGPGPVAPVTGSAPSFTLALQALAAMSHHEVAGVGSILVAWALCRGAPNRVGLHVLVVFWALHQIARLNVFLGVVNPAERFLPEPLQWLREFFGPAQNSPLLFVSITLLAVLAVLAARAARRAPGSAAAHGLAIVALLLALGSFEHLLLAVPWDSPFWDIFLRLRA